MLVTDCSGVGKVLKGKFRGTYLLLVNLSKANLLYAARNIFRGKFLLNHLTKVGMFVSHQNIGGANVSNHARNTHVWRRCKHVLNKHVYQLIFGVWLPCTLTVFMDQLCSRYQCTGVELDLVREKSWIRDKRLEVLFVCFRRCPKKIHH